MLWWSSGLEKYLYIIRTCSSNHLASHARTSFKEDVGRPRVPLWSCQGCHRARRRRSQIDSIRLIAAFVPGNGSHYKSNDDIMMDWWPCIINSFSLYGVGILWASASNSYRKPQPPQWSVSTTTCMWSGASPYHAPGQTLPRALVKPLVRQRILMWDTKHKLQFCFLRKLLI